MSLEKRSRKASRVIAGIVKGRTPYIRSVICPTLTSSPVVLQVMITKGKKSGYSYLHGCKPNLPPRSRIRQQKLSSWNSIADKLLRRRIVNPTVFSSRERNSERDTISTIRSKNTRRSLYL